MVTCCSSNKCLDLNFLCPNQASPARLFRKRIAFREKSVARRGAAEEWTNHLPVPEG
jgi:hypothetical protein